MLPLFHLLYSIYPSLVPVFCSHHPSDILLGSAILVAQRLTTPFSGQKPTPIPVPSNVERYALPASFAVDVA